MSYNNQRVWVASLVSPGSVISDNWGKPVDGWADDRDKFKGTSVLKDAEEALARRQAQLAVNKALEDARVLAAVAKAKSESKATEKKADGGFVDPWAPPLGGSGSGPKPSAEPAKPPPLPVYSPPPKPVAPRPAPPPPAALTAPPPSYLPGASAASVAEGSSDTGLYLLAALVAFGAVLALTKKKKPEDASVHDSGYYHE